MSLQQIWFHVWYEMGFRTATLTAKLTVEVMPLKDYWTRQQSRNLELEFDWSIHLIPRNVE